jgi:hypothetical protein
MQWRKDSLINKSFWENSACRKLKLDPCLSPCTRINIWDYMKSKSFCITIEMVSKLKWQFREWEKIFASYTFDKGLVIIVSILANHLNKY